MPTGLMIVAGILCLFVPVVLMILINVIKLNLGFDPDSPPVAADLFISFGWIPGLVILPFALGLAHWANKTGVNGWLLPPVAGALFGALATLVLDAGRVDILAGGMALGALYGAVFWLLAHGFSFLAARKARQ